MEGTLGSEGEELHHYAFDCSNSLLTWNRKGLFFKSTIKLNFMTFLFSNKHKEDHPSCLDDNYVGRLSTANILCPMSLLHFQRFLKKTMLLRNPECSSTFFHNIMKAEINKSLICFNRLDVVSWKLGHVHSFLGSSCIYPSADIISCNLQKNQEN